MGKYLLAYRGGKMAATDEERQAAMAAWGSWFGELGSAVVDAGNPFAGASSVASDGDVSGGAPSALTGYSVSERRQPGGGERHGEGMPDLRRRRQRRRLRDDGGDVATRDGLRRGSRQPRPRAARRPDAVSERRMFGGLAFLVGGHMAVAVSGRGGLLVRVGPTAPRRRSRAPRQPGGDGRAGDDRMGARRPRGRPHAPPGRAWVRRASRSRRRCRPSADARRATLRAQRSWRRAHRRDDRPGPAVAATAAMTASERARVAADCARRRPPAARRDAGSARPTVGASCSTTSRSRSRRASRSRSSARTAPARARCCGSAPA